MVVAEVGGAVVGRLAAGRWAEVGADAGLQRREKSLSSQAFILLCMLWKHEVSVLLCFRLNMYYIYFGTY